MSELIYPFINFFLLFIPVGIKLRGILKSHFENYHKEILTVYEHAKNQKLEAQNRRDEVKMKFAGLTEYENKIKRDSVIEVDLFKKEAVAEAHHRIEKSKIDSVMKIDNHKVQGVVSLKTKLISSVIDETKESIHEKNEQKKIIAKKMMNQLAGL